MLPSWLVEQISNAHGSVAQTAAKVLRSIDPLGWNESSGDGWEMFDACALAAWADPTLVECSEADVWVDQTRGRTSLKHFTAEGSKSTYRNVGKARIAHSINAGAFFDFLRKTFRVSH